MILRGENKIIESQFSSQDSFSLDASLVSLYLTAPDFTGGSTELTTGITVTPSPGPAKSYIAEKQVNFPSGGIYGAKWKFRPAGQTMYANYTYFSAYTDVWTIVRNSVIGVTKLQLTDAEIDVVLALQLLAILDIPAFSTIDYNSLTGPDILNFDNGLAYLTAATITKINPSKYPDGALKGITQGPVEFQFATNPSDKDDDLTQEGIRSLYRLSSIKATRDAFNKNNGLYALSGRSRGIKEAYFGVDKYSPLYLQLTDINWLVRYSRIL